MNSRPSNEMLWPLPPMLEGTEFELVTAWAGAAIDNTKATRIQRAFPTIAAQHTRADPPRGSKKGAGA
jgi:hypothetical protein